MPDSVRRYLLQSLQTRVEVELAVVRDFRSPWFDVDQAGVRSAAAGFVAELAEHAQIPAEEWQTTLERAVRNAISYHARPARTLLDFLFARADDIYTTAGLERKLAFFLPYPRLVENLGRHVEENGLDEVDHSAMAGVLGRIDREFAERYDVASWMQLFRPMFEVASMLPAYQNEVPVALAVAFFRDKGVERVEIALEKLHEVQGVETLSPERLKSVLAEARADQDRAYVVTPEGIDVRVPVQHAPTGPKPPSAQPAPTVRPQGTQRPPEEVAQGQPAPVKPDPVPLWKQFQHGQVHPAPAPAPMPLKREAEPPRAHAAPETPGGERKPLWMRYAHVAPRTPAATLESPASRVDDLDRLEKTVLGDAARDRSLFLRFLFGGSKADYSAVLFTLSRAADWSEASRIIASDVFQRNQVDIYSDAAVAFTNAVESRFEEA